MRTARGLQLLLGRARHAATLAIGMLVLAPPGALFAAAAQGYERGAISAGGRTTCAVLAAGQADCWGFGESGQLGDGLMQNSTVPVVAAAGGEVRRVAVGSADSCFLLAAGTVRCAGANNAGQLGDGTTGAASPVPREVLGLNEAVDVSAGGETACAATAQGRVYCWGAGGFGLLGTSATRIFSEVPVEIAGIEGASQVSVGATQACALLSGGRVECWGKSNEGQLGGGLTAYEVCEPDHGIYCSRSPVDTGVAAAVEISAGNDHVCALLASGSVECWGANGAGELGTGTADGPQSCSPGIASDWLACSTVPRTVPGLSGAVGIAAGEADTCAALSDGTVSCWGQNSHGELGTEAPTACYPAGRDEPPYHPTACTLPPTPVPGAAGVRDVSTGGAHLCAIGSQGAYRCWGRNSSGELGDGSTVSEPVVVTGPRPDARETAATLEGVVDPAGRTISACTFEYGPGTSLEASAPCAAVPGPGGEPVTVAAEVGGLLAGTPYTYRLSVTAGAGTVRGAPESFATELVPVLPYLGRCETATAASGEFEAAGCTASRAGGPFSWAPWPLAASRFTGTVGKLTLETPARASIKCSTGTLTGEYTRPQSLSAVLTLTGCQAAGLATGSCHSTGAGPGEVRSPALLGRLGAVAETPAPKLGWELAATEGPLASLECGATPVAVLGAAIGTVTPVDKMSPRFKIAFAAKRGLQSPAAFLGGDTAALALRTAGGEQAAGLKAKLSVAGEEAIELKAIP